MNNTHNKKPKWRLSNNGIKKYYCLGLLILLGPAIAKAQTKPVIKAAPMAARITAPVVRLKPIAFNIVDYQKTPQAAARRVKYSQSLSTGYSKKVPFSDGSYIKVTYSKKAPANMENGAVSKNKKDTKKSTSDGLICTQTTVELNANSDSFLSNDQAGASANIYPGAVYTINNLANGTYQQQTGQRNPIMITTDNPNTSLSYVTVQNPNMGTLNAGIAQIYSAFDKTGGQESFAYQVTTSTNTAAYNLAIGAAVGGYGADVSNTYSNGDQSKHVHLTIDAMKTLFSISTVPPDNGIFQDASIENNPDLTYINEVSYGISVLANVDITFSSQTEADAFATHYSGFGFTADLSLDYSSGSTSTSTTINGYVVGGSENQVVATTLPELKRFINKVFANATFADARPISYEAMTMDGEVVHNGSLTSTFTENNCIAANGGVPEIQNIEVTFTEGSDGKDLKTPFNVVVVPGLTSDINKNIMFAYNMPPNTLPFNNGATNMVILSPNSKGYKGPFDQTAFASAAGGRIIVTVYPPPSGYDIWDITTITVTVIFKPSAGNNVGAGPPAPLTWNFSGPNMIALDSRTNGLNQAVLTFDGNMAPTGAGAQTN